MFVDVLCQMSLIEARTRNERIHLGAVSDSEDREEYNQNANSHLGVIVASNLCQQDVPCQYIVLIVWYLHL